MLRLESSDRVSFVGSSSVNTEEKKSRRFSLRRIFASGCLNRTLRPLVSRVISSVKRCWPHLSGCGQNRPNAATLIDVCGQSSQDGAKGGQSRPRKFWIAREGAKGGQSRPRHGWTSRDRAKSGQSRPRKANGLPRARSRNTRRGIATREGAKQPFCRSLLSIAA